MFERGGGNVVVISSISASWRDLHRSQEPWQLRSIPFPSAEGRRCHLGSAGKRSRGWSAVHSRGEPDFPGRGRPLAFCRNPVRKFRAICTGRQGALRLANCPHPLCPAGGEGGHSAAGQGGKEIANYVTLLEP